MSRESIRSTGARFFLRSPWLVSRACDTLVARRPEVQPGSPPREILRLDFNTSPSLISRATRLLFRQHPRRLITTGVSATPGPWRDRKGRGGGEKKVERVCYTFCRYLPDVTHGASRLTRAPTTYRLVSPLSVPRIRGSLAARPVLFHVALLDLLRDSVMSLCLDRVRLSSFSVYLTFMSSIGISPRRHSFS